MGFVTPCLTQSPEIYPYADLVILFNSSFNNSLPSTPAIAKIHNSFTFQRGYEALLRELSDFETFNGMM